MSTSGDPDVAAAAAEAETVAACAEDGGGGAQQDDDETAPATGGKKHHDDGAADLEKVTDFAEEKDDLTIDKEAVNILSRQDGADVAKITIKREDVDLIVRELLVSKAVAEKRLREHRGNAKAAMKAILGF